MDIKYSDDNSESQNNINNLPETNLENDITLKSNVVKYDHIKKMEIKKKIEKNKKK